MQQVKINKINEMINLNDHILYKYCYYFSNKFKILKNRCLFHNLLSIT
jgi:hypothetical protein